MSDIKNKNRLKGKDGSMVDAYLNDMKNYN